MNGKRARARRRQQAAERKRLVLSPTTKHLLDQARAEKDRNLGKLAADFGKRQKRLLEEFADKRREVWRAFDERRNEILRMPEELPEIVELPADPGEFAQAPPDMDAIRRMLEVPARQPLLELLRIRSKAKRLQAEEVAEDAYEEQCAAWELAKAAHETAVAERERLKAALDEAAVGAA